MSHVVKIAHSENEVTVKSSAKSSITITIDDAEITIGPKVKPTKVIIDRKQLLRRVTRSTSHTSLWKNQL